jgi:hypothetical protein
VVLPLQEIRRAELGQLVPCLALGLPGSLAVPFAMVAGRQTGSRPMRRSVAGICRYTHVATLQMKDASEQMTSALWGQG